MDVIFRTTSAFLISKLSILFGEILKQLKKSLGFLVIRDLKSNQTHESSYTTISKRLVATISAKQEYGSKDWV